jgi:hypothetical protein
LKSGNLSRTANVFNISQKNIRRWIDKVKVEYSTAFQDVEKKLFMYISDYLLINRTLPSDLEIEKEAKEILNDKENQKFNKIWMKEFLKKIKSHFNEGPKIRKIRK